MQGERHNDGGSAFPSHGSMGEVAQTGMSLRDYLAAHALPGVHAEYLGMLTTGSSLGRGDYENMAADAYTLADAMLKARNSHAG